MASFNFLGVLFSFMMSEICSRCSVSVYGFVNVTKLGTEDIGMTETTPIVFNNTLYIFESVRSDYPGNALPDKSPYLTFVNLETKERTPPFGAELELFGGCAVVSDNGTMFAFGTQRPQLIHVFWSVDLVQWGNRTALALPNGYSAFNTSVTKGGNGLYVMAIELGAPADIVGVPFTIVFATSPDLMSWTLMDPTKYVYNKSRYTACPAIRFDAVLNSYFMLYLESIGQPNWQTYIVQSYDLANWTMSDNNPVLRNSALDYSIFNNALTPQQQAFISSVTDDNNSDPDLCEFIDPYTGQNVTLLTYMWGDQQSTITGELALASFQGSMTEFFLNFFPEMKV